MEQNSSKVEARKLSPQEFLNSRHALAEERAAKLLEGDNPRSVVQDLIGLFTGGANDSEAVPT